MANEKSLYVDPLAIPSIRSEAMDLLRNLADDRERFERISPLVGNITEDELNRELLEGLIEVWPSDG